MEKYNLFGEKEKAQQVMLRVVEYSSALHLVQNFFKDEKKSAQWLHTANHLLGGISPKQMIDMGRFEKLRQFIKVQMDDMYIEYCKQETLSGQTDDGQDCIDYG